MLVASTSFVGLLPRRQLFANAAIAASRVALVAVRRRTVLMVGKGERPHV